MSQLGKKLRRLSRVDSLMAPAASSGLLGRGVEGEAEEEEPIFSLDLQPLPNTYLGFYREWRKINPGNQGPLTFLREKMRTGEEIRRAQILSYAYDSHSINRSAFHTMLILLGETGVGKSSTINHLFGANVSRTSATRSETRNTTEYVLKEDDVELGVKDLSLGVIDTPGFNDTEGIEQDAANLACIHDMLLNHAPLQSLSGKDDAKLFPNVILLLVKATEKRFEGANSNFAKALMAIRAMQIVDTKRNNVLLALTNVMSFGNPRNARKWHNQLRTKSKKLQSLVEKTLEVTPEVVWIENHYHSGSVPNDDDDVDDHRQNFLSDRLRSSSNKKEDDSSSDDDEEEGHGLEEDGEWTLLPDGTKQIFNLYKGIADMLKIAGDNLGLHTINTLFRNRYDGPVTVSCNWKALDAKRDKFRDSEEKMLLLLKRDYGLTDVEEDSDCEVKAKIKMWIKVRREQGELDEMAAMEAFRLNVILVSQLKILREEQLVSHSVGSIKQNMPIPENLTRLHVRMLGEIFGVREEKRRPPVVSCLGRGYDVLHDEIKARNIFDFKEEYSDVAYEIQVPSAVVLNVARQTSTFMEDFQSEAEYVQRRLSDLQVSLDAVNTNIFHMKNRGGFTRSKDLRGKSSVQQYSYLLEKRLFQLTLSDLEERQLLSFSQSFARSLKSVPTSYDRTSVRCVRDLQDFFNNWGQYVVVQAYAGGSMEVKLSVVHNDESDGISNLIAARIKISGMLHSLAGDGGLGGGGGGDQSSGYSAGFEKGSNSTEADRFFMASSSVNWRGGDTDFQVPSLDQINANVLHQWEQSLAIKPAVLTTDLTLVPIYELVPDGDEERRLTLRSALDDLLRGELRVDRVCPPPSAPPSSSLDDKDGVSETLEEIAARVKGEVAERKLRREGGEGTLSLVKTRKAAVETTKPITMCSIL